MNFDFSDELKQLRDEARRFLTERCPTAAPRRILESDAPYDRALWHEMAEMGWTGAAIPEEYGGAGLGRLAVCVLAEELGPGRGAGAVSRRRCISRPRRSCLSRQSAEQKAAWLPRLAAGEAIGMLRCRRTPRAVPIARKHRRAGRPMAGCTAAKQAVPDGDIADFAVVACTWRGAWLHLVDLSGCRRHARNESPRSTPRARTRASTFDAAPAEPLPGADGPPMRSASSSTAPR